jgi:hypothetical protein
LKWTSACHYSCCSGVEAEECPQSFFFFSGKSLKLLLLRRRIIIHLLDAEETNSVLSD